MCNGYKAKKHTSEASIAYDKRYDKQQEKQANEKEGKKKMVFAGGQM